MAAASGESFAASLIAAVTPEEEQSAIHEFLGCVLAIERAPAPAPQIKIEAVKIETTLYTEPAKTGFQ